jgi:hypothetical protein
VDQNRVVATLADAITLKPIIESIIPTTQYTIKVLLIGPNENEYRNTIKEWEADLDHELSITYTLNRMDWLTSPTYITYIQFIEVRGTYPTLREIDTKK